MSADILVVDDEADIRNLVKGILDDEGYKTRLAASAKQAYEEMERAVPDLVILDIWLQGSEQDGLQILSTIKQNHPRVSVVMISGHGTIETAVTSIKQGAYDFIEKPFKSDRLLLMARRALEAASLRQENEALKKRVEKPSVMIGGSPAIQSLRQILQRVAPTNSRILLTGEAGSGKEVAARLIHASSQRAAGPFAVINCAMLRPDQFEAELFGSDEPAKEKAGVLEQADKGTLLLDEVSDMPLETQGKIVRVLQEQRFRRNGGAKEIGVDVRIIAASNRDLEKLIADGKFRQDLFYRLNVVPVHIPALRERTQDIGPLLEHFVQEISEQSGLPVRSFSDAAIVMMQGYGWPGNIRQLRNAAEWAMIMKGSNGSPSFEIKDLPPEITGHASLPSADSRNGTADINFMMLSLREAREMFEREYLLSQIKRFNGNISKTAQFVGMERSALHRKLKSLQVITGEREEDHGEANSVAQKRA